MAKPDQALTQVDSQLEQTSLGQAVVGLGKEIASGRDRPKSIRLMAILATVVIIVQLPGESKASIINAPAHHLQANLGGIDGCHRCPPILLIS